MTDNTQTVTYYSVDFNDGTNSQDTYPEDIKNYNCKEDGPPLAGAAVEFIIIIPSNFAKIISFFLKMEATTFET